MKRILIVLVLIISCFSAMADEFFVKIDYILNGAAVLTKTMSPTVTFDQYSTNMAFDLSLGARKDFFDLIYVSGTIDTYMYPMPLSSNSTISFNPFYVYYMVSTGIFYKNFTLSYTHQCTHPVDANLWALKEPILNLNTGYDAISLEWKVKF